MPEGGEGDIEMTDDSPKLVANGILGKAGFLDAVDHILDEFHNIKINTLVAEGVIDESLSLDLGDVTENFAEDVIVGKCNMIPSFSLLSSPCSL